MSDITVLIIILYGLLSFASGWIARGFAEWLFTVIRQRRVERQERDWKKLGDWGKGK